jgi:L-alanine-DL-glutamate epimerase-like enolase superfamily enzyme
MEASVRSESWPIRDGFRIARGGRTVAEVVVVEVRDGESIGRGECVPYARYGESVDSVIEQIEAVLGVSGSAALRARALSMPTGAARNAIDCALWDLAGARARRPVWALVGQKAAPRPVSTMRTVSVGDLDAMRSAATRLRSARMIKVKVDGGDDLKRIAAVHAEAPDAELIVDANEAWSLDQLAAWLPSLPELGVTVLEQPLPAGEDSALQELERALPICADESFHDRHSFPEIDERYDVINVKLDKAGGLTEALECVAIAKGRGLQVMVGCMVCTSLATEPALLLAAEAEYVDLDGPLLLERDRPGALHDREAGLLRPSPSVWGGG